MRHAILQLCPFSSFLEDELQARYRVHQAFGAEDWRALDGEITKTIRAVVTGGHLGIASELMSDLPALGLVAVNGVGYDKVDLEEARRRGIRVSITPGVLTDDVADLAVGLVIALLRQLPRADEFVRRGKWADGEFALVRTVTGRRFGIVGLGNIGNAIARRLEPFGPVAYCDTSEQPVAYTYCRSTVELARQSDVLILSATANKSTYHLVGGEVLDALGPDGYLVNVSRGSLVDEDALIRALREGRVAGAALDVFEYEPRVPEELRQATNVVLTPHIASATIEAREAMAHAVLANLAAFFAGAKMPGAIL